MGILADIVTERERQNSLKRAGRFQWTLDDPTCPDEVRLACLVEEVGEVAKALLKNRHDGHTNLQEELLQVAALAVAWLEHLKAEEAVR